MEPTQAPDPQPVAPAPSPEQPTVGTPVTVPPVTNVPEPLLAPAAQVPAAAPVAPIAPVLPITSAPMNPVNSKKPLLIAGAVVLLLLAGGGALALSMSKKSSNVSTGGSTTPKPNNQSTTTPAPSAAPAAATSIDKLVTLCYSFNLPSPHEPTDGSNSCVQKVRFGTKVTASINVGAPTVQYSTFKENVDEVKSTHKYDTIISQGDTTLGKLKAYQIIYSSGTTGKGIVYKEIVADVSGRGYVLSGVKLNAISTYAKYQDDEFTTKAQYDTVINSFTWK